MGIDKGNYYYGARYYDPKVSHWLSVDPLAGQYPFLSPYAYVANNPVMLVDPDGRRIKVYYEDENGNKESITINKVSEISDLKGVNNEFVQNIYKTLSYLKGNSTVRNAIEANKTAHVTESDRTSFYDKASVIRYNPYGGLELVNDKNAKKPLSERVGTGYIQSPAIGFLHELGHFMGVVNDGLKQYRHRTEKKDENYDNKEERRVILQIENPAVMQHLEYMRTNHSGLPVEVDGPTFTEKKSNSRTQYKNPRHL